MAGFIRYKLPGDKPRRRGERTRYQSDPADWSPPPIRRDTREEPPSAPKTTRTVAAVAGGLGAWGVFLAAPVWHDLGATAAMLPAGAALTFGVLYLLARVLPIQRILSRGDDDGEPNPRAGVGQVYLRLLQSVGLVWGGVWSWGAFEGGAVIGIAALVFAVIWPLHAYLRYRRFRQFGDDSELAVDEVELLE